MSEEHVVDTESVKFGKLTMWGQYDDFINCERGTIPMRVYYGPFGMQDLDGNEIVRWHFGFHRDMIEPVKQLLETAIFWCEPAIAIDGDFYVYWLTITSRAGIFPHKEINREARRKIAKYNDCLGMARRWARG